VETGDTDGVGADTIGEMGGNDLATSFPPIRQRISAARSIKNTPTASQRNIFM
jgi:hypothetical protein